MDPLPAKDRVLAACRGNVQGDHPVLRWASELTELHRQRLVPDQSTLGEIEQRRRGLINTIDTWIAHQLPPSLGCARIHTESLGTIIDRLSEFTAVAHAALTTANDGDLQIVWERLAVLAVGYDDLQDEVSTGRRRLPGTR